MLQKDHSSGRVQGHVGEGVPGLVRIEDVTTAIPDGFGSGLSAFGHTLLAIRTETNEPTEDGAKLFDLIDGQISRLDLPDFAARGLLDNEGIDNADEVFFSQAI
jgi:hypothetical protein